MLGRLAFVQQQSGESGNTFYIYTCIYIYVVRGKWLRYARVHLDYFIQEQVTGHRAKISDMGML